MGNKQYGLKIPSNVICGCGSIKELIKIIQKAKATRIGLFVDPAVLKLNIVNDLLQQLESNFKQVVVIDDIKSEPEDWQVKNVYHKIKDKKIELLAAIGGGSVMDTAKIVAVMLTNIRYENDLTDTTLIEKPAVPLVAVPTSSGTGSEATPNSIILFPEKKIKIGVVHEYFLPLQVILDPELTISLPPSVTAATGLDAFCHCIETYISKKSNYICEMFSLQGIKLIGQNLREAYTNGENIEAREKMLLAAFYGGVAISCSSTVAVHALSYPLGGRYRIPHGVSNAILLPYVMKYNMGSIGEKATSIAKAMCIDTSNLSQEQIGAKVVEEIFRLTEDLNIPSNLKHFGINSADITLLANSASQVTRLLDQNPKKMSLDDITAIYGQVL